MPIVVDIDVMLARRKMPVGTLAERVGITPANLAVLKNGRAKAVRFTTLAALCEVLECQPGDLLRWEPDGQAGEVTPAARPCPAARTRRVVGSRSQAAMGRSRQAAHRAGSGQPLRSARVSVPGFPRRP